MDAIHIKLNKSKICKAIKIYGVSAGGKGGGGRGTRSHVSLAGSICLERLVEFNVDKNLRKSTRLEPNILQPTPFLPSRVRLQAPLPIRVQSSPDSPEWCKGRSTASFDSTLAVTHQQRNSMRNDMGSLTETYGVRYDSTGLASSLRYHGRISTGCPQVKQPALDLLPRFVPVKVGVNQKGNSHHK